MIKAASPLLVKLLPALQVSLKVAKVVNVGLNIARCFFPVVPVLTPELEAQAEKLVDSLSTKSSAEEFACVQEGMDEYLDGSRGPK